MCSILCIIYLITVFLEKYQIMGCLLVSVILDPVTYRVMATRGGKDMGIAETEFGKLL